MVRRVQEELAAEVDWRRNLVPRPRWERLVGRREWGIADFPKVLEAVLHGKSFVQRLCRLDAKKIVQEC